jgi:hypothetical protein
MTHFSLILGGLKGIQEAMPFSDYLAALSL